MLFSPGNALTLVKVYGVKHTLDKRHSVELKSEKALYPSLHPEQYVVQLHTASLVQTFLS